MHILMFNWKDHTHPYSGGAEYVTHQYAKHLVRLGHKVTLFTSSYKDALSTQSIDGVKIIRKGNWMTVYVHAVWNYMIRLRHQCDVVIDQIHGIPFFTPLFVNKPILTWIHEIAGEIWKYEWPWISWFGLWFEKMYLKLYSRIPFLTDSYSTKMELVSYGVNVKNITVIPLTIVRSKFQNLSKTKNPQLIFVGRLSAMKRVDWLLRTVRQVQSIFPNITTVIVGTGKSKYVDRLKNLSTKLNLKNVKFLGSINEKQKFKLLSASWLHIHPSVKEGFGLTVLEASNAGTPTIAFDVPGLRDQINNGKNGVLVQDNSPECLADTIIELLENKTKLQKLYKSSMSWSKALPSWKSQTIKLETLLQRVIKKSR